LIQSGGSPTATANRHEKRIEIARGQHQTCENHKKPWPERPFLAGGLNGGPKRRGDIQSLELGGMSYEMQKFIVKSNSKAKSQKQKEISL
jgi:hypothetical protein